MHWTTLIPTRRSLVSRLKRWEDEGSWREFYEIYHGLIFGAALKAGLTEAEAEDAVQETIVAVAKAIKDFEYDPAKCRFKTWLFAITKRQVARQFRKRLGQGRTLEALAGDNGEAPAANDIPDTASAALEEVWQREWEENLVRVARERVRRRTSPAQFMIYEYQVLQEHTVGETARALGVSASRVYLAKHRIGAELKKEVALLLTTYDQGNG